MKKPHIRLPKRENIFLTNDEDPVNYYYLPLVGLLYRKRLEMATRFIKDEKSPRILDVGCGSGIHLPELSLWAEQLFATDIHPNLGMVKNMLKLENIHAQLQASDIQALPYDDEAFDITVCVSVLEHMDQISLPLAISELRRVTSATGSVIVGFPTRNLFTNSFYKLVGFQPAEIHPSSHNDVVNELKNQFSNVILAKWPSIFPIDLAAYVTCQCVG